MSPRDVVVDATLGGAGHSLALAKRLGKDGTLIGFDLDHAAIGRAERALADAACRVVLVEANFRDIEHELISRGITAIDKALFDLGWSGFQLDAGRGFSFLKDEPLSMSYRTDAPALNAYEIVNEWAESSLADVIYGWGEERYARRIAHAIAERRASHPIESSRELGEIVSGSVPAAYRYGRIHPATKTFQALRIAVNDELGALRDGIAGAWHLLAPGGRIAIITFHSIEDRLVKQTFLDLARADGVRITTSPITPREREVSENPRSRSAKLRIIQKTS